MHTDYSNLISITNLFQAWNEFRKGKRKRLDVQVFERNLEDNLFTLHECLHNKTYKHGEYQDFYVNDPKQRHIHKASVFDRIVHHLLYTFLYKLFDKSFIYDSYSCRENKGTHKGVFRLVKFTRIVSKNYTRPCWALKCDIKKFFASVDHEILLDLIKKRIKDEDILRLFEQVINSFCSCYSCHPELVSGSRSSGSKMPKQVRHDRMEYRHKGIPLGNLTSQVFANIYLNELDQFVKHKLKIKSYIRYADDFILVDRYKDTLQRTIIPISEFLRNNLKLELHPNKIILRRLDWGIDFLGYIILPYYILPRTKTKRRMFKKLKIKVEDFREEKISVLSLNQTLQSYFGYLSHANSFKLSQKLKNQLWFWRVRALDMS